MSRNVTELLPMLGLRITAGPLELRGITDDDLGPLCELAARGIHDPERLPFMTPWTDAPAADLTRNTAQYHWRLRAEFSAKAWSLQLGVWHEGTLVGTQGLETRNFLVTRTGETGSWLGREFQGKGIGTAMRKAVCTFAFDHLDATEVTSAAFLDNPASIAVSRKVGYRDNGITRKTRREGEVVESLGLVLTPAELVRGEHPLQVDGLAAFRESIGLS